MVRLLELGRRQIAERGEQAALVVPCDPLESRELDVLKPLPGPAPIGLFGLERSRIGVTVLLAFLALFLPGPICHPARAQRVFDPGAPPDTRFRLTPSLSFGASVEIDYSFRYSIGLTERRRAAAALLTPELSLAWSFDPASTFQAFLNVALGRGFELADTAGSIRQEEEEFAVGLREAYFRAGNLADGFAVLTGRQRFDDERKWLYDRDLDAIRLRYGRGSFLAELSASRNGVVRTSWGGPDERERTNNYVLHAIYVPHSSIELEGYAILRDDRTADRPLFFGVRARGEPVADLDYWLELSYVGGRAGSKRIGGWGVDLGGTYEWQIGLKPSVTLGFAFGSGDRNPDDSRDRSFRQTGLQTNEWDFGGSTDFKYYGEILDPELSNLAIFTVSIGIRPSEKWSMDLVYHYYLQHHASTTLRNAAIDVAPSGRSRRLGSEIDVIVGIVEILGRIEAKVGGGYFLPGAAFPGGTGVWGAGVEATFRF